MFLRGTNVLGRKENFLGTFVPKNVPRRGTFVPKIRENVPMELGCNEIISLRAGKGGVTSLPTGTDTIIIYECE